MLRRALVSEFIGTAVLLTTVVGSGVMAERLSGGNLALALLANSVATGTGLIALIITFGHLSAHFNPVVTLHEASTGRLSWRVAAAYVLVQVVGAVVGVLTAHLMFDVPVVEVSEHVRAGAPQLLGEFLATAGLIAVIVGVGKREAMLPVAIGAYITSAYWFTSSTSFANPAVTIARALTNTFSGIRPADVAGFIAAQLAGGVVGGLVLRWLTSPPQEARG